MKLLIINGPNLNLLGVREPDIYGKKDFAALEAFIREVCAAEGIECELFQSNHEGAIVDKIQSALGRFDGECYNIGLIDVCNRPYPLVTEAYSAFARHMYPMLDGQIKPEAAPVPLKRNR